jgi:hypothetical protein
MGTLKPGATYIYERNEGEVYAREAGADPSTREIVGHDYDARTSDGRPLHEHIMDAKMWGDIRRAARTNPALQAALERVKVTYYLTEDYEKRYGNRKT